MFRVVSSPTYEDMLKCFGMRRTYQEVIGIDQDLEMVVEQENEVDLNLEGDTFQKETDNSNERSRLKRKTPSWMMDTVEI